MVPRISVITPTYERSHFLSLALACFQRQSTKNIEWLILDDSARPDRKFENIGSPNIRYAWSKKRLTIGAKRNWLVDAAKGNVIIHFDDDDYYAPDYIESRIKSLEAGSAEVSILSGFAACHLENETFGYCETQRKSGPAWRFSRHGTEPVELDNLNIPWIEFCYGFSYVYKKIAWQRTQFREQNIFEDRDFVLAQTRAEAVQFEQDQALRVIHSVHQNSGSTCFPQFLIPHFMVASLQPDGIAHTRRAVLGSKNAIPDQDRNAVKILS